MLESVEEKKRFLASSEFLYDPMYQPSMDRMYHLFMQDRWIEVRKTWPEIRDRFKRGVDRT